MSFTTVSATVVDSDGIHWFRGSWNLTFVPNPSNPNLSQYLVDGTTPLSPSVISQKGTLDANGFFTLSLYDNTTVTPAGSSWRLTICPLSSAPCGFYNFAAAGASLDISSALTFLLPPPRFFATYPNYGYSDIEVILTNRPGATYYNVTIEAQKYYNDLTGTWGVYSPSMTMGTGVDLNTIQSSGVYYFPSGGYLNAPNPSDHTFSSPDTILEVFVDPSGFVMQRLLSLSDLYPTNFYIRCYVHQFTSTVWTAWNVFKGVGTA